MLIDFELKLRKIFEDDFWYTEISSPVGLLIIFGILIMVFLILIFR